MSSHEKEREQKDKNCEIAYEQMLACKSGGRYGEARVMYR